MLVQWTKKLTMKDKTLYLKISSQPKSVCTVALFNNRRTL